MTKLNKIKHIKLNRKIYKTKKIEDFNDENSWLYKDAYFYSDYEYEEDNFDYNKDLKQILNYFWNNFDYCNIEKYITMKLAFKQIYHRKIVQKILSKYTEYKLDISDIF